jgi:hypothetical protein
MAKQFIHVVEQDGTETRNVPLKLSELFAGAENDVLTINADGEYEPKPLPPIPAGGVTTFNGDDGDIEFVNGTNTVVVRISARKFKINVPIVPVAGSVQKTFIEKLTIVADNVLPALTFTPSDVKNFWIRVNGVEHTPNGGAFTVDETTKIISLLGSGDYGVKAGWYVEAEYYTDEETSPTTLTSFTPVTATVGQVITITGTGFNGVLNVVVGGVVQTAYTVNSATKITVTLETGTYTGSDVVVETQSLGTATLSGFTFVAPLPTITSFAPATQFGGSVVTIIGTNFLGVSAVKFGSVNAASFVVDSDTQITATLGSGGSGTVSVTTLYGTATLAGFTYVIANPVLTGFAPALATAGTQVVITGINFTGTTSVQVNGVSVHAFVVDSATQITATISKTNASGTITVQNASGTGTSAAALTIDQILPFARSGRAMNALATTLNARVYAASSVPVAASAWQSFNNNAFDWWLGTGLTSQRLIIRFPFKLKISRYEIRHASYNTNNYPRDWTLEGSNDGVAWTVLDTKTVQPVLANQTVNIPITAEYEYYSINIQQAQSAFFNPAIAELVFDIIL